MHTHATSRSLDERAQIPLWIVLSLPFIVLIIAVVALTGYLSLRSGEQAVDDLATRLLGEISTQIEYRVQHFLDVPYIINQTTAIDITSGNLDTNDPVALREYFWRKVQVFDTVTSIYFGNPDGGLINSGREGAEGSLYVIVGDDFAAGPHTKYATGSAGNPTTRLQEIDYFDARTRPWYEGAVANGAAYWASPYVLSTGQDMAIAASLPMYDAGGMLIGVTSVDIFISHVTRFLQDLHIGDTGQAFIVEDSGLLIASSTGSSPFVHSQAQGWQRFQAVDSDDPVVAAAARAVVDDVGGFAAADREYWRTVEIASEPYYLWVTPYDEGQTLDWVIVIAIPEADFLSDVRAQNRVNVTIMAVTVLLAILLGLLVALHLTRPIIRLSAAATALARGDWTQTAPVNGVQEIRRLGRSFNAMAAELHSAFEQLEQRVRERTAELAASESRYRAIVEDQTELICRFLPDHTLTFVNAAYCRYYGKSADNLLGTTFMPFIPSEDQASLAAQLATLGPENPVIVVEHRVKNAQGDLRWMQWVNRALLHEDGTIREFQAVGRDITEQKQTEQQLQKALMHEVQLGELKSHFVATVSHEFRTPMTIMLNSSEILERYHDRLSPEQRHKQLTIIQMQIERMVQLLEDVLLISRADQGQFEIAAAPFDLAALSESVITEVRAVSVDGLAFEVQHDETCRSVCGDERLIRLILANLISNAAKYSPPGSRITLVLRCTPAQITLKVQDRGIGIAPEAQPHVFEPFFRADGVTMVAGSGLGLAIVKRCVEQYQGTVSFESTPGQGTTFTVVLPVVGEGGGT